MPDPAYTHDLFICHASEDKARFVEPLVSALVGHQLTVWYDDFEIQLGDDPRQKVTHGLRTSRFGLVIVSPYSSTFWPQAELSALFAQEAAGGDVRILPIRCDLTMAELATRDPLLAGRHSLGWELGVDALARTIADRVRAVRPTPQPRSPLYNVPGRRAQVFVGRAADVEKLETGLAKRGAVAVSTSIEGLAGVGKTELALQLIDRLSRTDRFPGGIVWFDAEERDLTPQWGGAIATALAVGEGPVLERAHSAMRIIASGGPALLVLDNVASWTEAGRPHPLPSGAHLSLAITTRERRLGGQAFTHVELHCLAPGPARELLAEVSQRNLDREPGSDDLLTHLDGHALAIELAGAFLAEVPDVTPAVYLSRLRAGEPVQDEVRAQVLHERTVSQALDATWERLDEPARQAWQTVSEFADADATLELLTACAIDESARRALLRFHLLAHADGRWTMHRLVRDYGRRAGSSDEHRAATQRFVDGCIDLAHGIELDTGYRGYRTYRPHFDHVLDLAGTTLAMAPDVHSWLLDRVGTGAQSAGDLPRAKELLERALASDLQNLGEDHPSVATSRSNLATVHRALGDLPRAKELHERALASALQNLGEDHPSVATSRSNLALVLRDLGDLSRAKELLERALASALQNLGEDHPSVATSRSNLALVLKALGNLPRAKELLERALASDLQNLGEDHPSVATRRSNLALVLQALGDLPRAKELLERALASDLQNLGEDHPSVATSRSNLALVLQALGDLPRAKELIERALASTLQNLGEDHPSVATRRSNLATVHRALGDLPRAKDLLERALASDLQSLGEDHPSVATRRFNLATVYEDLGALDDARCEFAAALASEERSLGPSHPSTAHTRVRLADVLGQLGHVDLARAEAERALRDVSNQPDGSSDRTIVERIAKDILGR
ncbi:MAG: tetratricopeptide repeat protein [Kofleriaceae bacterium]|nr:tetratricopeptide repeat protein [Kofleriaceae bacterium]MBP9170903.1 tetratricopeptide repeat protein [Kofleriaceae bacterium]MBP9860469.1 tetratricopeptide repeat protein [Kofleriaceae bacterium]